MKKTITVIGLYQNTNK